MKKSEEMVDEIAGTNSLPHPIKERRSTDEEQGG